VTPARALLAVLAGSGIYRLVVALLETVLVGAAANGPVTNEAEFFAVRNRPALLAASLGYNCVAAFLAGYVVARIAGAREMMLTALTAALQTALLIWAFTAGEYADYTPVWTRIALVVLTAPAMMGGAAIRARAAKLESPAPG
jgi:hypothetical protein